VFQAVNICFVVVHALCCTDLYVRNSVASVNVVQESLEEARSVNGLYHQEQKQGK